MVGSKMASAKIQDVKAELNSFVRKLVIEYESRHRVTVLDYSLGNQDMKDAGRQGTSSLFRLNLTFDSDGNVGRSSVIVKVPHFSSFYELYQKIGMYQKEAYMYKTVLPRFHQIWSGESISPTFFAASDSGILALENLVERGFRLPAKSSLLDLKECDIVLKRLAQFHGVSVKYFELHGTEEFDKLTTLLGDSEFAFHGLFGKIRKYVLPSLSAGQVETWEHFEEHYGAVLIDTYISSNIGGFNVMLHGDLHNHNFLLKGNECKFIDFQLSRRGSPVVDMTHFLINSVKWVVFEHHRERIFDHYLRVLNEVLEEVGCTRRYTLAELNADFDKYKLYCIYVLTIIPILSSEPGTVLETTIEKSDDVMQSTGYITVFKNWMEVVRRGKLCSA